jgi:hypothetical protein
MNSGAWSNNILLYLYLYMASSQKRNRSFSSTSKSSGFTLTPARIQRGVELSEPGIAHTAIRRSNRLKQNCRFRPGKRSAQARVLHNRLRKTDSSGDRTGEETAPARETKSDFLRKVLSKNIDLDYRQVNRLWAKKGYAGEISNALYYQIRQELGIVTEWRWVKEL